MAGNPSITGETCTYHAITTNPFGKSGINSINISERKLHAVPVVTPVVRVAEEHLHVVGNVAPQTFDHLGSRVVLEPQAAFIRQGIKTPDSRAVVPRF